MAMIDTKQKKSTIQSLIGLVVFIAVINLVPFEIIRSRRNVHTVFACGLIALVIFNYITSRKIIISWNEPQAICRARGKEKIISELRNTSWLRVSVYMLVLVPLFIRLPWYYLPVILFAVIFVAILHVVVIYYLGSSRIDVFEDGIRLWDSDRSFENIYTVRCLQ